ncbi:hypothetical protein NQ317_015808 [Molorchus minor]|uniref:DUF5641 domain-containing protein n=1 Tax=Molorchus minor TaxID=1323400 RepID=A0ABQ9IVJ2_9CUCU|nr:hypothetical protein NQ317_015808 [Molorchus minor]
MYLEEALPADLHQDQLPNFFDMLSKSSSASSPSALNKMCATVDLNRTLSHDYSNKAFVFLPVSVKALFTTVQWSNKLYRKRDTSEVPTNRLNLYERLQQIVQHFWRRWSAEYLTSIQQRTKWRRRVPELNVGDLVVIRDDNSPPLCWKIGRITTLLPGADGITRVVNVLVKGGEVKRSVNHYELANSVLQKAVERKNRLLAFKFVKENADIKNVKYKSIKKNKILQALACVNTQSEIDSQGFALLNRWSDSEIKLLLELYKCNISKFNENKFRPKAIYAEIATSFPRFTDTQIETKIKNLKKTYKVILDNSKSTGRGRIM